MKKLSKETVDSQLQFTQYCRTGDGPLPAGVRADRMHHYHRLITNIFGEILEDAFPVLMQKVGEKKWEKLCAKFVAEYPIQSYQSVRLPGEFADFIQGMDTDFHNQYPFAKNLVRFEWLEMELYFQKNESIPNYTPLTIVVWDKPLVLTPYQSLEQYSYPVFENLGELELAEKGDYFVLGLRKCSDHQVHFVKLNPLSAALVQQLLDTDAPILDEVISVFSSALGIDVEALKKQVEPFLFQLIRDEFLLGTKA